MNLVIILLVIVLALAAWAFVEFRHLKHKFSAIFVIGVLLFFIGSSFMVLRDEKIDYNSIAGMSKAVNLYSVFLAGSIKNVFSVTAYAINMDWTGKSKSIEAVNATQVNNTNLTENKNISVQIVSKNSSK